MSAQSEEAIQRSVELSIVVPCFNEEATLPLLYAGVVAELEGLVGSWELILVDDGSTDATCSVAGRLADSDHRVRAVGLSRNFGKEAAMLAGLRMATGRFVVLMDADLQHPPRLIPSMLALGREGWDQVIATRTRTREPMLRRAVSRVYYRLMNHLMDVRLTDGAGDFRLISRRCVDALLELGESHRFSKGMFVWVGFSQTEIHYENVLGTRGASSWSFSSLFNYGIDGLLSFNTKPLRLVIWVGCVVVLLTAAYALWILVSAVVYGVDAPGYVTTIAITALLGGVQLMTLGVIGEYVGRTFNETKRRPLYLLSYDSRSQAASGTLSPATLLRSTPNTPNVIDIGRGSEHPLL